MEAVHCCCPIIHPTPTPSPLPPWTNPRPSPTRTHTSRCSSSTAACRSVRVPVRPCRMRTLARRTVYPCSSCRRRGVQGGLPRPKVRTLGRRRRDERRRTDARPIGIRPRHPSYRRRPAGDGRDAHGVAPRPRRYLLPCASVTSRSDSRTNRLGPRTPGCETRAHARDECRGLVSPRRAS